MGNVRTEQIKHTAKELVRRFPNRFTNKFDDNKRVVSMLVQGTTPRIRNQIAGYITRIFASQMETTSPSENLEEKSE